ncbi:hypothetical protein JIN85_16530 [Luteolibacter pohnpeiensis]|uniref:Uncharacterized protein n=1 Tax=Luteolibacter pohnpeiensis TaxID=454153 RepID=A0A934S8C4_9BACT|nr:hypothetical protein [Luteolibacter pohnpeiensis]MBK1884027.1 hypothetical protein [Luteolibacter pohnpeiensis]
MPTSINGIGTRFYGAASPQADGSVITTKWFAVIFIPLIPLSSYRVKRHTHRDRFWIFGHSASYSIIKKLPIQWRQVLKTYSFALFFAVWLGTVCLGSGLAIDKWQLPLWVIGVVPLILGTVPFIALEIIRAKAMKHARSYGSAEEAHLTDSDSAIL